MESLYKEYPIKMELKISSRKEEIKDSYLIRRYIKKISLIFCFLILISIPVVTEYFLKTSYLASVLIIFIVYPFFYILYRIDKWAMNCKYMP